MLVIVNVQLLVSEYDEYATTIDELNELANACDTAAGKGDSGIGTTRRSMSFVWLIIFKHVIVAFPPIMIIVSFDMCTSKNVRAFPVKFHGKMPFLALDLCATEPFHHYFRKNGELWENKENDDHIRVVFMASAELNNQLGIIMYLRCGQRKLTLNRRLRQSCSENRINVWKPVVERHLWCASAVDSMIQ